MNMSIPEIAYILGIPDFVVNDIFMFLPPTSRIPTLKIAPILAIVSPWGFERISFVIFLNYYNFG